MDNARCVSLLNAAFDSGIPIADIEARSHDAPFILEGEEFELEWREILFPVAALPNARVVDRTSFDELKLHEAGELTLRCPPLILVTPTEFSILDGWRRIAVAQLQATPRITLVVAKVPEIIPL